MKTGLVMAALMGIVGWCVPCAAGIISTSGDGDGMAGRDWYSNPNYYWVDTTSATVDTTHHGSDRWWYRGVVIFDVSSVGGTALGDSGTTLNFYSFGFTGVSLQYAGATGAAVTTAFGAAGGQPVAALECGEGWQTYDVTSFVKADIAAGTPYIGFIFNTTVNNAGGTLASAEDPLGRGAFLSVGAAPEPGTLVLLGMGAAVMLGRRRRG